MRCIFIIFFVLIFLPGISQVQGDVDRILSWVEENQDVNLNGSLDSLEFGLELTRLKKDLKSEVKVLLRLSQFTLIKLNNVSKASEYLERIKDIADSKDNDPWVLGCYHNGKGVLYYYEGTDKDRAFREFRRSIEIMLKAGLNDDPRMLNNYALAFLSEQNAQKALEIFMKCRTLELDGKRREKPSLKFLETIASNIGVCYIYMGKIDSAEFYFQQAIDLSDLTPGYADDFSSRVYLGVFYEEQGEYQKAIGMLSKAEQFLEYSPSWGMKSLMCQAYMGIYRNLGDYRRALEYSEQSKVYEDSLRNYKLSEQAFAMDYKLELDKVKALQEIQSLEVSVKEQKFNFRITVLTLLLVLMIVLGGFVFYRLNKQKELNRIKAEKEFLEKERIRQQAEIDILRKEEELIHANVELNVQKNELSELKNRLQAHLDKSYDPEFDDLKHFLKQVQKTEKKTEQLKYLDHVLSYSNSAFYSRLKELHPNLTEDEMRLATLIRLNLSSDELIQVFNISMNSLMTKRYRMRKKLDLPKESGLEEYIMSL